MEDTNRSKKPMEETNIFSSYIAAAEFETFKFHPYREEFNDLNVQLQLLEAKQFSQHGFVNNTSSMKEINSAMGGLCSSSNNTTYDNHSWMKQKEPIDQAAFVAPPRMHPHQAYNYCPAPPMTNAVSMAMNPSHCQYLQEKIKEGKPADVARILFEVKDHLHQLMIDPCGNYLIESIFKARTITNNQLFSLVFLIISNIQNLRDVCINNHGTRVMQIMLENIICPTMKFVVAYTIKRITVELMKNVNGGYVIVQCLKLFQPEDQKVILDKIASNCVDISTDKIGCSVIQKCLNHGGSSARVLLVSEIASNAMVLAEDPYGNYVLQYLIKMDLWNSKQVILDELRGNFVRLSMNKHASNVVEDLLRFSNQNNVAVIVGEIMSSCDFLSVLQDPYGNYVAQRALKCTEGHLRRTLSELIKSKRTKLHSHVFGKRVLAMAISVSRQHV